MERKSDEAKKRGRETSLCRIVRSDNKGRFYKNQKTIKLK